MRSNSESQLDAERARLTVKHGQLATYLDTLKAAGPITRFDETLWHGTVEQLRGMVDGKLRFIFKGGKEIGSSRNVEEYLQLGITSSLRMLLYLLSRKSTTFREEPFSLAPRNR